MRNFLSNVSRESVLVSYCSVFADCAGKEGNSKVFDDTTLFNEVEMKPHCIELQKDFTAPSF